MTAIADTDQTDPIATVAGVDAAGLRLICVDPDQVVTVRQARGVVDTTDLSPDGIADLVESIRLVGQVQPAVVSETGDGRWLLWVGERRLRAVRWLIGQGAPNVEGLLCWVISDHSTVRLRMFQLVENHVRRPYSDAELAEALLHARAVLTLAACAEEPQIAELYGHPEMVGWDGQTSWDHARRVARVSGQPTVSWEETIDRLGLDVTESAARRLSRLLRTPEDSESGNGSEDDSRDEAVAGHSLSAPTSDSSDPGGGGDAGGGWDNPDQIAEQQDEHEDGHSSEPADRPAPAGQICPQELVDRLVDTLRTVADTGGRLEQYDYGSARIQWHRISRNSGVDPEQP